MNIEAHTVAADHPNAVLATERHDLLFAPASLRACLAKAGGDDHDSFDTFDNTILHRTLYIIERGCNDRQVYRPWHIAQAGVGWPAQHLRHRWIDQINIAGEASGNELFGCDISPFM